MRLRSKLLLAQLPLALALVFVGYSSRRTIASLDHDSQDILKDNYQSVVAAQHMRDDADALLRHPSPLDRTALRARFEHELGFQESNITEAGEQQMTERLRANWQALAAALDTATPDSTLTTRLEAVERSTAEILSVNQEAMVRKSERARSGAEAMSAAVLGTTLIALALGLLSSIALTTRLVRPLSVLSQAARRLGQGDLVARARIAGRDEIAEVAADFNTMAEHLLQYRSSSLGELLAAQQAAQATIDSLPDPVLVLALDGKLLNANRAAEDLLGIDANAEGSDAVTLISRRHEACGALLQKIVAHIAGGRGAYVPRGLEEALAVATNQGPRQLLLRGSAVAGEAGEVSGLTVVMQDVTRLRRFDELKSDLVATVAHEFRTPLTSLRMAIHLCVEETAGPLSPKQSDLLHAAREDCERLQGIVDDLLDLSRISAGRIELHTRPVPASALVEAALDAHRAAAKDRGVALELGASSSAPVTADSARVDMVLTNLVTNALRYTAAGGRVCISTAREEGSVRFSVEDSGVGVAPEFVPHLFERFYRVPGSPGGGAGLGLYICKEIVEAHGGTLGVDSSPGRGSVFWFTLPTA